MKGILDSGELFASHGRKNARYGDRQYFTDLAPELIAGRRKADLTPGQLSAGKLSRFQLVQRLFGVPRRAGYNKTTHFVEIDVTGLNITKGRDNVFVHLSNTPLDISSRIVRSGKTPF